VSFGRGKKKNKHQGRTQGRDNVERSILLQDKNQGPHSHRERRNGGKNGKQISTEGASGKGMITQIRMNHQFGKAETDWD